MMLSVDSQVAVCMPTPNRLGLLTVVGRSDMGLDVVMIAVHAEEIIFERMVCSTDCGLGSEHFVSHFKLEVSICIMPFMAASNVLFVKNETNLFYVNRNHAAILLLCSR